MTNNGDQTEAEVLEFTRNAFIDHISDHLEAASKLSDDQSPGELAATHTAAAIANGVLLVALEIRAIGELYLGDK